VSLTEEVTSAFGLCATYSMSYRKFVMFSGSMLFSVLKLVLEDEKFLF